MERRGWRTRAAATCAALAARTRTPAAAQAARSGDANNVSPVDVATGRARAAVTVGHAPDGLTISPATGG